MTGLLLDTHVLLWMSGESRQLSRMAADEIARQPRFVSAISLAEIAIKTSLGKLPLPAPFATDFGGALRALLRRTEVDVLPVGLDVVERLRQLPLHHRDPFDRLIIAQAFAAGLTIVSRDRVFAAYDGLEILEV